MKNFWYIPGNHIEWIVLIMLTLSLLFIIFTYLKFYLPAILYKDKWSEKNIPVSVIICAKNEEENLNDNLLYVLQQDYPDYEVIIVNDCSADNTEAVIDKYIQQYPNRLKKINIPESDNYKHGKKMALFIGIKHAKNEHFIFTDADCKPASDQWLKIMAGHFDDHKEIVLAYGKYQQHPSFLNKLIRYDTITIALQYLSSAIKGNPYMGVGRNLAYTKSLFFKNKGFANHYHINSGDDDLFVNETATSSNTAVCINPDAFTISDSSLIFKHWLLQKARHFNTAPLYKNKHKWMLGWIFFFIGFFHLVVFLSIIFFSMLWQYILLTVLFKSIFQSIIMYHACKKLDEKGLHFTAFILEPCIIISYFYIVLHKKIKKL